MLSGSIFTSSDKGSASLLPIEIALLSSTWRLGNSLIASLLADYTDAPASFTIIYSTGLLELFITSAIKLSLSLDAVPLPIAITSMLNFSIKFNTFNPP